jgi:aspartate ammonia-lyase
LTMLDLLARACDIFARLCVEGISADRERCRRHVAGSTATITALVDRIGYEQAEQLALAAAREDKNIRQLVIDRGLMTGEEFDELTSAERVNRLGAN